MGRLRRIYTSAVLGSLGGLVAAVIHQLVFCGLLARPLVPSTRLVYEILLGLVVGASIGFFPSFAEGLGQFSFAGAARAGQWGALLGAAGGMIAFPTAELLHRALGGGYTGRILSVSLLGLLLGFSEARRGGAVWWRGVAGGLAGGMLSGAFIQFLVSRYPNSGDASTIALIVLGLTIACCVAIFVHTRPLCWLEGLPGSKVHGQVYHLAKFLAPNEALIGSDKKSDVFIWVPGAQIRHASLSVTPRGTVIKHIAKSGTTSVNKRMVTEALLSSGDIIAIGDSMFRYREKKRATVDPHPTGVRFVRHAAYGASCLSLVFAAALFGDQTAGVARITHVDSSRFPHMRVAVRVTDPAGAPITYQTSAAVSIYEDGVPVASRVVTGVPIFSVLVLDVSGSMQGEKLSAAKAAASDYIKLAHQNHRIAVVAFSDTAEVASDFTNNTSALLDAVDRLTPKHRTAINDAVSTAASLLSHHEGRRTMLVLTDGVENASLSTQTQAISWANEAHISVSVVGLGADVRRDYLSRFPMNAGRYYAADQVSELGALFQGEAAVLGAEQWFEFDSRHRFNGSAGKLRAELKVDRIDAARSAEQLVVAPGFIPNVRGRLSPYVLCVLCLLAIPVLVAGSHGGVLVSRFRRQYVRHLPAGSPAIGEMDPNRVRLKAGDLVVFCPVSKRIHHIRSWRLNRCTCMHEPKCAGHVCYQYAWPSRLRRTLDVLTARHRTGGGRSWLCRCAGDTDGY